MAPKEVEYQPIEERSSDDLHDGVLQRYSTGAGKQRWERAIWIICILAILISNGMWLGFYHRQKNTKSLNDFSVRMPYHFSTPYIDGNISETNKLWADLFPPGFGAIKVEHSWAAEQNLPPTQGDAADGKAIYTVAAFHHLHCLTVIRTSLFQFNSGRDQLDPWSHISHCLDSLRQGILCLADPAIGPISVEHECRDFEALKAWTAERAYTDFLEDL
ncbi:hypothetical protein ACMFMG_004190 [Clarireedia jacksonii]